MSKRQSRDIKPLSSSCVLLRATAQVRTYSFEDELTFDLVLAYLKALCTLLEERQKEHCANFPKRKKEPCL